MNGWTVVTWIAVGILLTVPVIVFARFVTDAARIWREFARGSERRNVD